MHPRFPEIVSALTWGFVKVQGGFHGSTKLVPERVKITVTASVSAKKLSSTKPQSSELGLIWSFACEAPARLHTQGGCLPLVSVGMVVSHYSCP